METLCNAECFPALGAFANILWTPLKVAEGN